MNQENLKNPYHLKPTKLVLIDKWKPQIRQVNSKLLAFFLDYIGLLLPRFAFVSAVLVIGYILNPIDLIPDLIPVFRYRVGQERFGISQTYRSDNRDCNRNYMAGTRQNLACLRTPSD